MLSLNKVQRYTIFSNQRRYFYMKIKFLKLKDWLILSLMGLMGFSSCHSSKQLAVPEPEPKPTPKPREEIRLMYGVPTMDYHISGRVKDANGKPVKGVAVNMLERGLNATADTIYGDQDNIQRYLKNNEVRTDGQGRFVLKTQDMPRESVRVLVRDTDGKAEGEYKNQLLEVPVDNVDRSKANGMYQGTFIKTMEIELEEK